MHIGVNLGFGNLHADLSDEQMYAGEIRLAELADQLGFDSLWAVEHHFDDYAMCPDNVLLLAHLAARTQHLKLGTGAVILPWNEPLRVAEKMIMLDILSGGRAIFGMGRGLSRAEYAPFGIPMEESRARFDEAAAMITEALETGYIQGSGPFYPRPRTRLRPGPRGSFRGRLYCVAGSPDSVVSCVGLGASLMSIVTRPVRDTMPVFDGYREQWRARYASAPPPISLNVNLYCHEDAEAAQERSRQYIATFFASNVRHYEMAGEHFARTAGYERYAEVAQALRAVGLEQAAAGYAACALTGTPNQILEQLADIASVLGDFELIVLPSFGGMPYDQAEHSLELFAKEVMPAARELAGLTHQARTVDHETIQEPSMAKLDVPAVSLLAEHNAPAVMRDGTILRADIYRAAEGGPFPVLLVRNPYGEPMVRSVPLLPAVEAGFTVVVQHCRGTGTSDGEFTPFENEADDGIDTIEWCAGQSWCDGAVAMYGPSYLGMVQFAAAVQAPPALRCLLPSVTPADYYGLAYRHGAFQLGQLLGWYTLKSAQSLQYRAGAGEDVAAGLRALYGHMVGMVADYAVLPLREAPAVSRVLPAWQKWLDHPSQDAFWKELSYATRRDAITTPALHVGGWFDLFLGGTLDNYQTLRRSAATEHARRNQALVIGPWTHMERNGTAGELNFGMLGSDVAAGLERQQLDFARRFTSSGERALGGPRVRLFVMGDNVWRDEDDWPLARTWWQRWFLHPDRSLSPAAPPPACPASEFSYDPADPAPTVGSPSLIPVGPDGGVSWLAGPRDQRGVEARPDVLSFTSEELTEDLEVTGPLTVTLHAATSAADTDFTAKLVDVWPDGRAMSITDGIVRARYRDGTGQPSPITPGSVQEYTIDLIATSLVFKPGHRIRVDVSSSNFPCFDRNPGNGAPAATATEDDFVVARQAICHDAAHPSYITLPVIPRGSARPRGWAAGP